MRGNSLGMAALTAALTLAAGCGGGTPRPVRVAGVVLLDGNPLAGATVRFTPEDSKGQGAYGLTEENGNFHLTSQNGADGALPGQYKVVITPAAARTMEAPEDPEEAQR